MKAKYSLGMVLLFVLLGATLVTPSQAVAQATDITPAEAMSMIDSAEPVTVIDVSPLWADGHIPGALHYFVGDGSLDAALPDLDMNGTYLVYCHTDEASNAGTQKLVDAGFTNVYRLQGNFGAWSAAGYDIETPAYTDVSPGEAHSLIENEAGLIVIDVSPHYLEGHLPGAVSYPLTPTLDTVIPHLDKNGKYLVYCHADGPSISGSQALIDAGFSQVWRLEGNYSAWTGAGYAIEVPSQTYTDIEPAEAQTLIGTNPDLMIIDVSPLWAEGHIPGALHLFVGDGTLDAAIPRLDRSADYLVYCHTDEASMAGAQKLADAGFGNVRRLAGNFGAWTGAGYQTETPAYTDVSASDANAMIESHPDLTVIDVSPLYKEGHVPGSFSFSLGDGTLETVVPHLDANGKYLVYCHTDAASMSGSQALVDAGFSQVWRLEGNFAAWTGAGYDTVMSPPAYRDVTADAAKNLIETVDGITIIDVSPLYDEGHIPDAVSMPLGDGTLDEEIPDLDTNAPYLVYCHTDAASMTGAEKLVEAGIANVFRLKGNYAAWVDAGYEVSMPTSVEKSEPLEFKLDKPFPNPFNPSTTIGFTIPAESEVTLDVYDIVGRKVAELVNARMSAGSHSVNWDGRDIGGNIVSSGVYFYRLNAGAFSGNGKMMFLR